MVSAEASGPSTVAELWIDDLDSPAEVYRDEWGVPHIRALSAHDAFLAQGYVSAQDRLWQMDMARREMQGRAAEWFGQPRVAADRLARRLGVCAASRRDYAVLSGPAREMLDAYAAGVNAFLARASEIPLEYRLLDAQPEAWEPWHCIDVMRQRGYLMGSLWFKLWRACAIGKIAPDNIAKLRYDDSGGDRLCIPAGVDAKRWTADLTALRPSMEALRLLGRADSTGGGSNNWAVSGSRTSTGRPLLGGDPHRDFELPGIYAQMHIACAEFDAVGLTVPGVPAFPHFAHNGSVAWCVTHAFADIHDLFVERFDPTAPHRYLHRGEWRDATVRTETINVKGSDPVSVEIIETVHGPVVAGNTRDGAALTLLSVQFAETDLSFDALPRMLHASSCDALFEATRGWGLIDHNLVAADVDGHIAHLVRAIVPQRPQINGWLPVPGWTGEYDWGEPIPWEHMPRMSDPGRGYIVTANNRTVVNTADGEYISTDVHPPYRAKRIEELLAQTDALSPTDARRIHSDDLSAPARLFQKKLSAIQPESDSERAICNLILNWDARMSPDSHAATAYSWFRWELARAVSELSGLSEAANHKLAAEMPPGVSPADQLWWTIPALLRENDDSLLGGQTWDDVLHSALAAIADKDLHQWGNEHRARFTHPLAIAFPLFAKSLSPDGAHIGGDNETVWVNGCRKASNYDAVYGAVARYVFDVGDWHNSKWIVVAGSSGDPESPHYFDQHDKWAHCELIPMHYDWAKIRASGQLDISMLPS